MALGSTALVNFVVVVLIGIAAGVAFYRSTRTWLSRLGPTGKSDVTSALVGIAGSFVGFHLGVILGIMPTPPMLYLSAVVGAVAMLWLWRGR
jgi:hypothetical protein